MPEPQDQPTDQRGGTQLSGASGKALQASSDLVRRWLRVGILVMKCSYSMSTEPRLIIARTLVDELVAVAGKQASLKFMSIRRAGHQYE